jgi:hypothetical protein
MDGDTESRSKRAALGTQRCERVLDTVISPEGRHPVFKTGAPANPGRAGSIPVRLCYGPRPTRRRTRQGPRSHLLRRLLGDSNRLTASNGPTKNAIGAVDAVRSLGWSAIGGEARHAQQDAGLTCGFRKRCLSAPARRFWRFQDPYSPFPSTVPSRSDQSLRKRHPSACGLCS